ncbi:MAG: twin-arginine translocation signal domain-containing protein, partial [Lachnospiraceae bacterium]|nr:twin-arginine translocation signal domain-containing protein [Lachnospiraceae bacterium]
MAKLISRRDFLRGSLAGAASIALSSACFWRDNGGSSILTAEARSKEESDVWAGTPDYQYDEDLGANQPWVHTYRLDSLLDWEPETDLYAKYLRARIPLQKRIEPFSATQANTNLTTEAQALVLGGDYHNESNDMWNVGYLTTYGDAFTRYCFNFWQYINVYASWHGEHTASVPREVLDIMDGALSVNYEYASLNLPNPSYTNAAHKNGVRSLACIGLAKADENCKTLLAQDADGNFPCAKRLAEMSEYFGYDGYFFNQECAIDADDIDTYKAFLAQLRECGCYVQWYDAIDSTTGEISYQNAFNDVNAPFVYEDGVQSADSIFLNYWWNSFMLKNSRNYARTLGLDPLSVVFAGVEGGLYRWVQPYDLTGNKDDDGQPMNSIAIMGADMVFDVGSDLGDYLLNFENENQWKVFERERIWWSGPSEDPTCTGSIDLLREDLGIEEASNWAGIADQVIEKSVISGSNFHTNFNTGHGLNYYLNGEAAGVGEWYNITIQDILPTWQWRFEALDDDNITDEAAERMSGGNALSSGEAADDMNAAGTESDLSVSDASASSAMYKDTGVLATLTADFDYGDGYDHGTQYAYETVNPWRGPASLVISGELGAEQFLYLYRCALDVNESSTLSVTFRKSSDDDASMLLGLVFADDPEQIAKIEIPNTEEKSDGWSTETVSLFAYAGRQIAAFGLLFEGTSDFYQMNVGELKIIDGSVPIPDVPTGLTIDSFAENGEVNISWDIDSYDAVKQYNIYAVINEKEIYLGGTYDEVYYVKDIQAAVAAAQGTSIASSGSDKDEVSAEEGFETAAGNNKSSPITIMIKAVSADGSESEAATVTADCTAMVSGVEVTAEDGYLYVTWNGGQADVTVTTLYEKEPRTWTASGDGSCTVEVASGEEADGAYYRMSIRAADDSDKATNAGMTSDNSTANADTRNAANSIEAGTEQASDSAAADADTTTDGSAAGTNTSLFDSITYDGRLDDSWCGVYTAKISGGYLTYPQDVDDWYYLHYSTVTDGVVSEEMTATRWLTIANNHMPAIDSEADSVLITLVDYSGNESETVEIPNGTAVSLTGRSVIQVGVSTQFTATVIRAVENDAIEWQVRDNKSADTAIDENGLLTVALDETASSIRVKAISAEDANALDTLTVTVYPEIALFLDADAVYQGDTVTLSIYMRGEAQDPSAYTWSLAGQ